jgi:hypothetical protein
MLVRRPAHKTAGKLLLAKADGKTFDELTFAAIEAERAHGVARRFQKVPTGDREERRLKKLLGAPARLAIWATTRCVQLDMRHPLLSARHAESRQRISVAQNAQNLLRNEKSPLESSTHGLCRL